MNPQDLNEGNKQETNTDKEATKALKAAEKATEKALKEAEDAKAEAEKAKAEAEEAKAEAEAAKAALEAANESAGETQEDVEDDIGDVKINNIAALSSKAVAVLAELKKQVKVKHLIMPLIGEKEGAVFSGSICGLHYSIRKGVMARIPQQIFDTISAKQAVTLKNTFGNPFHESNLSAEAKKSLGI